MTGSFATQLHMLPDLIQKLTVVTALVLLGLVGGIGTGLHSVFDCCHHCQCSSASCTACPAVADEVSLPRYCGCLSCDAAYSTQTSENTARTTARACNSLVGTVLASDLDCAICRLLSHFHSTPNADSPEHYVWGSRRVVTISLPAAMPDKSLRLEPPRGPPA